jgi:tagatose 6-phosphate kinase
MADRDLILCVGTTPTVQRSMTFDRVEIDGVNRAVEVREYASGKSPNVARVLRTLGADPLEVGFIGGDRGRFLLADLERAGVRCAFVTVAAPTRLCTTVIDRSTRAATELVEESAPVEEAGWREMDHIIRTLLPQAAICVFSGSLPPGAPADFYARYIPLAQQHHVRVILDARGEALRLALGHRGLIVKLNREELAGTLARPLETLEETCEAARQILPAEGAVIVTLGARGAIASGGKQEWHVTPPEVKTISAVGSGDAFAAGLALEIRRGAGLPDALSLAAACGAANAMTAYAGHLHPHDVEAIQADVKVELIRA